MERETKRERGIERQTEREGRKTKERAEGRDVKRRKIEMGEE